MENKCKLVPYGKEEKRCIKCGYITWNEESKSDIEIIDNMIKQGYQKPNCYITKEQFEEKLIVGAKIRFGKEYAKEHYATEGEIITLVDGEFEYDNGLYTESQDCPSIWNEASEEFDSIYHLFGNDFENFMDCEILD